MNMALEEKRQGKPDGLLANKDMLVALTNDGSLPEHLLLPETHRKAPGPQPETPQQRSRNKRGTQRVGAHSRLGP